MTPSLRLAVVADGLSAPAWQVKAIERMAQAAGISLVGLIVAPRAAARPRGMTPASSLYCWLDRKLHRGFAALSAPAPIDKGLFAGVVEWTDDANGEKIWASMIEATACLGADFLVRFDDDPVDPRLVGAARLGLLGLRIGADRAVVGLEEQTGSAPVLAVEIRATGHDGQTRTAHRPLFAVHEYSLQRTLAPVYGSSASLFLKACHRLAMGLSLARIEAAPSIANGGGTLAREASSAAFLLHYGARMSRKVAQWSMFDIYHWTVAVAPRVGGLDGAEALAQTEFHPVDQPAELVLRGSLRLRTRWGGLALHRDFSLPRQSRPSCRCAARCAGRCHGPVPDSFDSRLSPILSTSIPLEE